MKCKLLGFALKQQQIYSLGSTPKKYPSFPFQISKNCLKNFRWRAHHDDHTAQPPRDGDDHHLQLKSFGRWWWASGGGGGWWRRSRGRGIPPPSLKRDNNKAWWWWKSNQIWGICKKYVVSQKSKKSQFWLCDFPKRFRISEILGWKRYFYRTKSQKNNHKLTWLLSLPYFDFCVAALYSSFLSIPTIATTWLKTERRKKWICHRLLIWPVNWNDPSRNPQVFH